MADQLQAARHKSGGHPASPKGASIQMESQQMNGPAADLDQTRTAVILLQPSQEIPPETPTGEEPHHGTSALRELGGGLRDLTGELGPH
jgi:hypothetical protein